MRAVLTQQVLAYARKQFMVPAPADLPAAIGGMTGLIRGSLGGRMSPVVEFAPGSTGLGLSQAYGVTCQLGGTLRLTSTLGVGTKADMVLPRIID